jgi:hypothetical protein
LRGDGLHLRLPLVKWPVCAIRGYMVGRDIDSIVFQIQCVLFRRQAEVGASFGQDIVFCPGVVLS